MLLQSHTVNTSIESVKPICCNKKNCSDNQKKSHSVNELLRSSML